MNPAIFYLSGLKKTPPTLLKYAYSLRRVVPEYTGAAIRVRRGASTTFQNIFFNLDGSLDVASLLSFVGLSSVGYIQTWYDQSGNGKNMVSAVSTREPIIVNTGGVLVTKNTKPATTWGVNLCNMSIPSVSIKVNSASMFIVCSNNTSTLNQRGIAYGGTDTTPATIFPRVNVGTSDRLYYNGADRITMGTTDSPNNKIYSMLSTSTGVKAWKNNIQIGSEVATTNTTTATIVYIGYNPNTGTELFNGTIQEMLFYQGDLASTGSTSRSSITADAISYYSIL